MADRRASLAGNRIGSLAVVAEAPGRAARYRIWRCRCDCGREEEIAGHRLRPGRTQVRACTACRTPRCRNCGAALSGPTRRRTCSPECRVALNASLAQEYRARQAVADPSYPAIRAAYNAGLLAQRPELRDAKRASDRRYRRLMTADAEWMARKRERWLTYYDRIMDDPARREKHRARTADARRERERLEMQRDIQRLTGDGDGTPA